MNCIVPPKSIKAFTRALFCLAKIGHEMVVQTERDRITFRVLSESQSAYAQFVFADEYFSQFRHVQSDKFVQCKVNLRTCLSTFKNLRAVQTFQLILDNTGHYLIFKLTNRNGIKRVYRYSFQTQNNILSVDYDATNYSLIIARPEIFTKALAHFDSSIMEAKVVATGPTVHIKSNGEDRGDSITLATDFAMSVNEFESYQLNTNDTETSVTFCLKEFKAMLTFCEQIDSSFHFRFIGSGSPIIIGNSITEENDPLPLFLCEIVLATLQEDESDDDDDDDADTIPVTPIRQKRSYASDNNQHNNKSVNSSYDSDNNNTVDSSFNSPQSLPPTPTPVPSTTVSSGYSFQSPVVANGRRILSPSPLSPMDNLSFVPATKDDSDLDVSFVAATPQSSAQNSPMTPSNNKRFKSSS